MLLLLLVVPVVLIMLLLPMMLLQVPRLLVSHFYSNSVEQYDGRSGVALGPLQRGKLVRGPVGITAAADGSVYVCSYKRNVVVKLDGETGKLLGVVAAAGEPPACSTVSVPWRSEILSRRGAPRAAGALPPTHPHLSDSLPFHLARPFRPGELQGVSAVAIGPDGSLFVASYEDHRIIRAPQPPADLLFPLSYTQHTHAALFVRCPRAVDAEVSLVRQGSTQPS